MKNSTTFASKLPKRSQFPNETVLFYDSVLHSKPVFKLWSRDFQYKIALKAGEQLKTLHSFEQILFKLKNQNVPQTTQLTFVAVGGGSVGDFVGFLASVFLRGRQLVHIPSTWLAAVDSAHGGKNGLNFHGVKNQIGTVYLPKKIFIIEELLQTQPSERLHEALGEVVKAGVINSVKAFEFLEKKESAFSEKDLIRLLPQLIEAKMKIVRRDPSETLGQRRVLNLGHTLGHVLESLLQIPHGEAVKLGILFSSRWSYNKGYLNENDFIRISNLIHSLPGSTSLQDILKKVSVTKISRVLVKDKKLTSTDSLDFIFIRKVGRVTREKVKLAAILKEIERQKTEF